MCFGQRDPEAIHDTYIVFEDPRVRSAFVRKVYFILMVQLLFTLGIICIFVFAEAPKAFVIKHFWLFWLALAIMFVLMIVLICCDSVRRAYPCNYICLGIFTCVMAFLLSCGACMYAPQEVMMAVGITAILCFALTVFAMQPWIDFTPCGGVLLVLIVVFSIFSIVVFFVPGREVRLVFSCLGALLYSFVLIFDTQLILGGKHKYAISPEEYIFAALTLYLDIVNLLMYILAIIGLVDS